MFDRVWEVIKEILRAFQPYVVLMPYERGVLTRLGVIKYEMEPGFHWCWPFHIDVVHFLNVVAHVEHIANLATITKDGKQVSCEAIVTYRISNVRKALFEVEHLRDAIMDTCAGVIGSTLCGQTWEDLWGGAAAETVTDACRKRGWKYGIEVQSVQLTGLAQARTIRLTGAMASAAHGVVPP